MKASQIDRIRIAQYIFSMNIQHIVSQQWQVVSIAFCAILWWLHLTVKEKLKDSLINEREVNNN